MPLVVFITDWKSGDYYRVVVEGLLHNIDDNIKIAFANNHINTHDVFEAAFILRLSLYTYPEDTIFVVSVKSVVDKDQDYVYARINNRHVFCANNGILGFLNDKQLEKVFLLPFESSTFPEKDIFIPAIDFLLKNGSLNDWADEEVEIVKSKHFNPHFSDNTITGTIIYIDSYGNAISNISKSYFTKCVADKNYIIYPNTKHESIKEIYNTYSDCDKDENELFAVFNSLDLLEIGIFEGNISELYNIKPSTNIIIEIL